MKIVKKLMFGLLVLLLLAIVGFSGWQLIMYYSESIETQAAYEALAQLRQEETVPPQQAETVDWSRFDQLTEERLPELPESPHVPVTHPKTGKTLYMLPEFADLFAINPDVVGWIAIPGTSVDYPVVQRKDTKNYYLYRDFYGRQVKRGCVYAREECDVLYPSDNVTLYGHMMRDGTMFADLANYTSREYWESHKLIRFDTLRRQQTFEIVAVFRTSASQGKGFGYHLFVDADNQGEFDTFWNSCKELALYDTGITPTYGDKLLTLSTCEYTLENGRLVVVARRIEE